MTKSCQHGFMASPSAPDRHVSPDEAESPGLLRRRSGQGPAIELDRTLRVRSAAEGSARIAFFRGQERDEPPDGPVGDRVAKAADKYAETKLPGHVRTKSAFAAMLPPELELVEPGITWNALWRPDTEVENPENSVAYAAVGRSR